jgi:hypothetical protein
LYFAESTQLIPECVKQFILPSKIIIFNNTITKWGATSVGWYTVHDRVTLPPFFIVMALDFAP